MTGSRSTTTPATSSTTSGPGRRTTSRSGLGRYGHVHLKDQRGGKGVLDFPVLGEGEIDLASILRDLAGSGFSGPVSMEIEFTDYEYPPWEECVEAARRGKGYWDSLDVAAS